MTDCPPQSVLTDFGVDPGDLQALTGGQETAWRAGSVVLKPLDRPPAQLAWEEQLVRTIRQDGFRLAAPVRTRQGQLSAGGWTAWEWLDGEHQPGRWADICAAGSRFHEATAGVPAPQWHRERHDVHARADRAVWDSATLAAVLARIRQRAPVDELAALLRPVEGQDQLVHGDLTGNVLFHPTLPPAIIDLSPYWRPPPYATAVVVFDALVWEGADDTVLAVLAGQRDASQYLLRAAIFRLVAELLSDPGGQRPPLWWSAVQRVSTQVRRLADRN